MRNKKRESVSNVQAMKKKEIEVVRKKEGGTEREKVTVIEGK